MPRRSFIDYKQFENISVGDIRILNCINPEATNIKDRKFNGICHCGSPRTIRQYDIVHRQKLQCKLCGYKAIGKSKLKKGSGVRIFWWTVKKSAEKRKIEFDLTIEQVKEIGDKNCYYCGIRPFQISQNFAAKNKLFSYIHNGIDRVDSNKGYIMDNCVSCCKYCNIAKSTMNK